ncbi:hypothetical protein AIIKEEIJ_04393 [Rhodococcus sp. YH1]|nr:hypothetical protein [Rhodococcus sp. YH1]
MLPYAQFHEMAEDFRYDVERLSAFYAVSYETIAHRMSTLQRVVDPDGPGDRRGPRSERRNEGRRVTDPPGEIHGALAHDACGDHVAGVGERSDVSGEQRQQAVFRYDGGHLVCRHRSAPQGDRIGSSAESVGATGRRGEVRDGVVGGGRGGRERRMVCRRGHLGRPQGGQRREGRAVQTGAPEA